MKFEFGDKVQKIGQRDVFLVTGIKRTASDGQPVYGLAALNWGSEAKESHLIRAA